MTLYPYRWTQNTSTNVYHQRTPNRGYASRVGIDPDMFIFAFSRESGRGDAVGSTTLLGDPDRLDSGIVGD